MTFMIAQRKGRGHRTDSVSADNGDITNGHGDNIDDENLPSAATIIAELDPYRQQHRQQHLQRSSSSLNSTHIAEPWPARRFPLSQMEVDEMERAEALARAEASSKRTRPRRESNVHEEEVVDEEWAVQGNTCVSSANNKIVLKLSKK